MLQQAAQPSQASLVDVQIRPSPDQVRPKKSLMRSERHFVPLADFLMLVLQGTHKRPPLKASLVRTQLLDTLFQQMHFEI